MAEESIYRSLHAHAIGMMVLLTLQYLLGEFTSLFIHFPEGQPTEQLWIFLWKQAPIALHSIIGFLLLTGTIALLVRAVMYKDKIWTIASVAAGIAVLGAAIAGITFVPTQSDMFSFIMAIYFLFALFAYFWGLYQSK